MVKRYYRNISLVLLFSCVGCQSKGVDDQPTIESWLLTEADAGLKITTKHYEIFTTVTNKDVLRQIPLFWESAFQNYSRMCDPIAVNEKKFTVYIFNQRRQWEDFTRLWCGDQAALYLSIQNGGYMFKSACVIYLQDTPNNFWVMGHEGWHQFSNQNFTYRLPAWIVEGLATTFEAYQWVGEDVDFDVELNHQRLLGLKKSLARNRNRFRLSELVLTDAGQFLNDAEHPDESQRLRQSKLNAYYSQLYAFIRFLREKNNAEYSQALKDILNDAITGKWPIQDQWILETSQKNMESSRGWNKTIGKLIFQTYIPSNPSDLEERYRKFCYKITSQF